MKGGLFWLRTTVGKVLKRKLAAYRALKNLASGIEDSSHRARRALEKGKGGRSIVKSSFAEIKGKRAGQPLGRQARVDRRGRSKEGPKDLSMLRDCKEEADEITKPATPAVGKEKSKPQKRVSFVTNGS